MQENKKKMISLGVTVMTLLLIVVGATYAYFAAQIDNGKSTDVDITAESVDSLTFMTGDPISFSITQDNFKQGGNNLSGSTTATAKLIAGTNNKAVYLYNVYLDITENEFIYTTKDLKSELILKVTDPENNLVTSIDGLTYNWSLGGFDITMQKGLITLVENYIIATEESIEQDWQVEVAFVNLNSNQTANAGKKINAKLKIQRFKEERLVSDPEITLADSCQSGNNLANCIKTFADNNDCEVTKIMKHDGSYGSDANDGSYRYSGGDPLNNNIIGSIKVPSKDFEVTSSETVTLYYSPNDEMTVKYIDSLVSLFVKIQTGNLDSLTSEEQEAYAAAENGNLVVSNKEGAYIVASKAYLTELGIGETAVNDYTLDQIKTILSESKQAEISTTETKTVNMARKYFYKSNQTNDEMTKYAEIKIKEQLYGIESINSNENKYIQDIENKGTIYDLLNAITTDAKAKGLNPFVNVIKNYVCFGSDAESCPNDDLYRIIGVFGDQVKLIKADYATTEQLGTDGDYKESYSYDTSHYKGQVEASKLGGYYFNYNGLPDKTINSGHGSNDWGTSLLNKTNLNINYITYLNNRNAKWANMIADTKWNIGGPTTIASKIGLVYLSDYGYATLPSNWGIDLDNYNTITDNNWMYMGLSEWTITSSSSSSIVFGVGSNGNIFFFNADTGNGVRPVMYLKSNVAYVKGDGTISNPFRISL